MIGRVFLDQGDVRVARLLQARRRELHVGIARPANRVGHEPHVGIARPAARGGRPDDDRARTGDRVRRHGEVVEQDVVIGAGVCRLLPPAFVDLGDMRRFRPEIGLGDAQLELGEIQLFQLAGALLPAGHLEVGEPQLGVAAQAAPAGQLIDVDNAEPPRAAVQERSHLARLSLGLEFLGAHPQNAGGFFQRIKLSHGRAPRGRDRRHCSRFSSILSGKETATRHVCGLRFIRAERERV